jgi:hypothetical protein
MNFVDCIACSLLGMTPLPSRYAILIGFLLMIELFTQQILIQVSPRYRGDKCPLNSGCSHFCYTQTPEPGTLPHTEPHTHLVTLHFEGGLGHSREQDCRQKGKPEEAGQAPVRGPEASVP